MRVLVIGGTGMIGSSIVQRLIERGDDVWVFSRGLGERPVHTGAHHLVGDRTLPAFADAIRDVPLFDSVIDMVCYQPAEAEMAVRAFAGRTKQFILTSTIDVYRKPAGRYPYTESEPYGGIGRYALDKVACERVVWRAYAEAGFPVTVIRPAATYGDRHPPVHTLGRSTTYLDRLRRGKPIVVHGDGSSFWVSCHADDIAAAFVGAVGNDRAIGRSYHAAGEEWVTWDQHHHLVAEAIGAPPPRLIHIPTDALVQLAGSRARLARDNFQYNNIFDNSAARADLGFVYSISLAEGLRRWWVSLEQAGLVEDSDSDPFDDQLIETWHRLIGVTRAEDQIAQ